MKKNDRIWELDALRGVCILCVIAVHLIYDLGFLSAWTCICPPGTCSSSSTAA